MYLLQEVSIENESLMEHEKPEIKIKNDEEKPKIDDKEGIQDALN